MAKRDAFSFQHVRTVGPMLPAGLLERVANPRAGDSLIGLKPEEYGLARSERLNEAIARSFAALLPKWRSFADECRRRGDGDHALGPANAFVRQLFTELGYGDLARFTAEELDGRTFELSNRWLHAPVHVVGANVPFEERTAHAVGAARHTPHDLVQAYLNRSEDSLWGILANGRSWRLLRDNRSVTRPAFVEFSLDGIFSTQSFADFRLFWLVNHVSRLRLPLHDGRPGQPHETIVERWHLEGLETGKRVLSDLRESVRVAIAALGRGFLVPAANADLRTWLAARPGHGQEYYRQLLRLVYRLLFLLVAEAREVLHAPGVSPATRELYRRHYSIERLRRLAGSIRGGHQTDLFEGLKVVMRALGPDAPPETERRLGLAPLGGYLWSPAAVDRLGPARIRNRDLLLALRAIGFTEESDARVPIDYKNLGSEELGSVYEQLLELNPHIDAEALDENDRFRLETGAGNDRKTSGSYYTPSSLVQCLLDSALDPVIEQRTRGKRGPAAAAALLELKVCDPAVGSGHFLIAAAHRIAGRVAGFRTGEEQPGEAAHRAALRDVIRRCLYGVDLNPMAAELCKVALWMESMEPGKPLSFLDGHIQVGNSLIGATPELIELGIPDDAFEPLEGDDKKVCSALKKQNKKERADREIGQSLIDLTAPPAAAPLASEFAAVSRGDDDSLASVARRAGEYQRLVSSDAFRHAKLVADAWCAAFFWRKDGTLIGGVTGLTDGIFRQIEANPAAFPPGHPVRDEIDRLAAEHKFFHFHLAFPEVFAPDAAPVVAPAGATA